MSTDQPPVSASCTRCPHLDTFHGSCTHELRQDILRELLDDPEECPIYSEIRAEAMRDLERNLDG